MPPYASRKQNDGHSPVVLDEANHHDLSVFDNPSAASKTIEALVATFDAATSIPEQSEARDNDAARTTTTTTTTTTEADSDLDSPRPSFLDRLLDWNPCCRAIGISNPVSILFEIRRTRATFGDRVDEFRGNNGGHGHEEEEEDRDSNDDDDDDDDTTAGVVKYKPVGDEDARNESLGAVLPEQASSTAALVGAARNAPLEVTLVGGRRRWFPLERAKKILASFSWKARRSSTDGSTVCGVEI